MREVRVGTSGWSYDHWRGRFYPEDLGTAKRLSYYCQKFDTVEVNSSFYHLPRETTFEKWRDSTPERFVFSVKASRYITHVKKLTGVEEAVQRFIERATRLGSKLGPILWQLPPQLKRNDEKLEGFLSVLPESFEHVFEFRDRSWICQEVVDLLDRYDASFCSISSPEIVTDLMVSGPIGYLRMHGRGSWYGSNYTTDELRQWAEKIRDAFSRCDRWFVYFNNDANAYAVYNALELRSMLESF